MRTIALAAAKGGAGKSTLTVHLATLAELDGPALIVDIDPQGSSRFWFELRNRERPRLVQCSWRELAGTLADAKQAGIAWCLVDCPPHGEGRAIAEAMRLANLVLIPMRPAAFDLAATKDALELAAKAKRLAVVINAAPPKRGIAEPSLVRETREALKAMGATMLEAVVSQRAAFAYALLHGLAVQEFEPEGKAALELRKLWAEIRRLVK